MKTLPSKLFPGCAFSGAEAAGFYDIIPQGYDHVVSLYLAKETVQDETTIANAAVFFDKLPQWDSFCRNAFLAADDEDSEMITEYFAFYQEEAPEVFGVAEPEALSLTDMVNRLVLSHMGAHGKGNDQCFNVDFTLGYDQLLSVYFDSDGGFDHMAWES